MRRRSGNRIHASRWHLPVVLIATCVLAIPVVARAADVESVALDATPDGARLTLELSGSASASIFTLADPDRVVIDLRGASADAHRLKLPAAQGIVHRVRTGPRPGGTLRVVLELVSPADARGLPLEPNGDGRRLVVEITRPDSHPAHADPHAPVALAAREPAPAPAEHAVTPPERAAPAASEHGPPAAAEHAQRTPTRDLVIAVDAGHGGDDPGATGRDGTREKDVTLAVARVLAQRINAEPGMRAVLTRSSDVFVPLRERIRRARVAQADLFVSVHADAVADRSVAGSSVYVLSQRGASSEAAKWLADRENSADLVGGVSLDDKDNVLASVLLDLSQSAAMSASMSAAEKVLDELNQVGEVRKARVQQAGFVVLKSPDIPSMLIESAYITNPGEERRLRDPRHQAELADAILAGLKNYFHANPPPGTRLAAIAAGQVASTTTGPAHAPLR